MEAVVSGSGSLDSGLGSTPPVHQHERGTGKEHQAHTCSVRIDFGDFAAATTSAAATTATTPSTAPAARPAAARRWQAAVGLGGLNRSPVRVVLLVAEAVAVASDRGEGQNGDDQGLN